MKGRTHGLLSILTLVLLIGAATAFAQDGAIQLSLADAVERAIANNLDVAVSKVDPLTARQDLLFAESDFDSQVDVLALYNEQEQEPQSLFTAESREFRQIQSTWTDPNQRGGTFSATLDYNESFSTFRPGAEAAFGLIPQSFNSSLTLGYNQSLLRNYGLSINRTGIQQAENNLAAAEQNFRSQLMDVIESVESSYWDLVGARRQLVVANQSLELAEKFLEDTKKKVDVGTLPPIEITTAEAEVASRDEEVIVAENNVADAEDNLRALLNYPPASPDWGRELVPTDEPGYAAMGIDVEQAIDTALAERATVFQAKTNLRNSELTERFRGKQTKPDLRVNGSYTLSGNSFDFMLDPGPDGVPGTLDDMFIREDQSRSEALSEISEFDNTNWTVRFDLSVPIGNRRARADHARSRLAVEQNKLRLEAARQQVLVEVRRAARQVETTSRRVTSARANVVLQRRKLDAEQKRYDNGLSTSFQVLEFQKDLAQAESSEISAIIDYNKALVSLGRSQGTLLTDRNVNVAP